MHLKSCCALLLLAFVACQAAPSPKIIDNSPISDTEAEITKDSLALDDTGADKDRAKKSATTFCVEVRSDKDEQEPKPLAILQSVPVAPAPTPLTIVQSPAVPAPLPTPVTILRPAPVPASRPLTIVQPAPVPAPAPRPLTFVQPAPVPVPAPRPVTIVQTAPAPAPAPRPVTIVQTAPAPAPAPRPVTIVQTAPAPEPAPCAPEPISMNVVQPAPMQFEALYVQPPQPQLAKLMLPEPAPQPASQIIVPAPAPSPAQFVVPSAPAAAPCAQQEPNYIVETRPAPQNAPMIHFVQPQAPQPQPTMTLIQQEPIRFEKPRPRPQLIEVVPNYVPSYRPDVIQCSCRHEHLRSVGRNSNTQQRVILPSSSPLESTPVKMMVAQNDPNTSTGSMSPVLPSKTRDGEARHHHHKQKIYLTPLQDATMYSRPSANLFPVYHQNNLYSKPVSYDPTVNYPYPTINYGGIYPYSYDHVPSVVVNAGGPFLGQTQRPRDAETNSESHSVISEVSDLNSNQKREADPTQLDVGLTQLKDAEQNEIMQQQVEKNRIIKEASADTIKIEGSK